MLTLPVDVLVDEMVEVVAEVVDVWEVLLELVEFAAVAEAVVDVELSTEDVLELETAVELAVVEAVSVVAEPRSRRTTTSIEWVAVMLSIMKVGVTVMVSPTFAPVTKNMARISPPLEVSGGTPWPSPRSLVPSAE